MLVEYPLPSEGSSTLLWGKEIGTSLSMFWPVPHESAERGTRGHMSLNILGLKALWQLKFPPFDSTSLVGLDQWSELNTLIYVVHTCSNLVVVYTDALASLFTL